MGVSQSGYYAWRNRLTKAPALKRENLAALISRCYWENRRRYGSRRIKAALAKTGIKVGRCTVRRVMGEQNLRAIAPKRFVPRTTDSKGTKASPNLLAAVKIAECAPAKVIIGDISYLPVRGGKWCYLAVWQDTRHTPDNRLEFKRFDDGGVGHFGFGKGDWKRVNPSRSDCAFRPRQSICFSRISLLAWAERLTAINVGERQRLATMLKAESFFSRFKAELIEGGVFEDIEQARSEVFSCIEGYYNRTRLHSGLG